MGGSNKARVGLGAVLLFTVPIVAAACDPTCPAFDNPCPERIDIGALCVGDTCTLDGEPTKCSPNCPLERGKVFEVDAVDSGYAAGRDLMLLTYGSHCLGDQPFALDLSVQLDDVSGAPFEYTYSGLPVIVFRWAPAPSTAGLLRIRYDADRFAACRR